MTAPGYEPPTAEQLAEDLRWATKGPLWNYYKTPDHYVKTPLLVKLISHLRPEDWERDANWALQTTVKLSLREKLDGGPERSALSWAEIGEYLCGFHHGEISAQENGERPGYNEYCEVVRELSGLSMMKPRKFTEKVTGPCRATRNAG